MTFRPIVDALNEGRHLARWVVETSGDKDLIRTAEKVLRKTELAANSVIKLLECSREGK